MLVGFPGGCFFQCSGLRLFPFGQPFFFLTGTSGLATGISDGVADKEATGFSKEVSSEK